MDEVDAVQTNFNEEHPLVPNKTTSLQVVDNRFVDSSHPKEIRGIPWRYLKDERNRLVTFVMYPSDSTISAIILASKGFAYLDGGPSCTVICCFCEAEIENMKYNNIHEIDAEHRKLTRDCPMVNRDKLCGDNIPMVKHYPQNVDEILSQFYASKNTRSNKNSNIILESNSLPQPTTEHSTHGVRQSQPSDQNAASAMVTSTTDVADDDNIIIPHAQSSQTDIDSSSQEYASSQNSARTSNFTNSNPGHSNQTFHSSSSNNNETTQSNPGHSNQTSHSSSSNNNEITQSNPGHSNQTFHSSSSNNNETTQSNPGHSNQTSHSSASNNNETHRNSNTQENNTQPNSESSDKNEGTQEQNVPSYQHLGIVTAKPKRPQYSILEKRIASFSNKWLKNHFLTPEVLAHAGFFHTGAGDLTRCFFCGGGLRNWEPQDDPFVEHARQFPLCVFLAQIVGKEFVDMVQKMNKETDVITYDEVVKRIPHTDVPTTLNYVKQMVEQDAAVKVLVDNGFEKDGVLKLAMEFREKGEPLSSDRLYEAAKNQKIHRVIGEKTMASDSVSIRKRGNEELDLETIEALTRENREHRHETLCKICMSSEVTVVFLPCGHLVSCTQCSFALDVCPVCRVHVKGSVKAYIG